MSHHEGFCPVCGYRTLPKHPEHVRNEVCPICYWEDDLVQYESPELVGGANEVSLNEARENYEKFGAVQRKFIEKTRTPTADDKRDPD